MKEAGEGYEGVRRRVEVILRAHRGRDNLPGEFHAHRSTGPAVRSLPDTTATTVHQNGIAICRQNSAVPAQSVTSRLLSQ